MHAPIRAVNWKRLIHHLFMTVLPGASIIIKRNRCTVTEIAQSVSNSNAICLQGNQFRQYHLKNMMIYLLHFSFNSYLIYITSELISASFNKMSNFREVN